MERGDSERAFRAARAPQPLGALRCASRVPAGVILLLGIFMLWTWLNPMRLLFRIPDLGGDLVISGTKITMQSPRVNGFTRDARPYELSAKAAAQDLTRPDVVELSDLHAKFQMQRQRTGGNRFAQTGTFHSKKELLELGNDIVVTSTNGYRVMLDKAVDRYSRASARDRSTCSGGIDTAASCRANSMKILESGELVRFDGVTMTIDQSAYRRKEMSARIAIVALALLFAACAGARRRSRAAAGLTMRCRASRATRASR